MVLGLLPSLRPPGNLIVGGGSSSASTGFSTRVSSRQSQNQPASQAVYPLGVRPGLVAQAASGSRTTGARSNGSSTKTSRATAPRGSSTAVLVPPAEAELHLLHSSSAQGDVGHPASTHQQQDVQAPHTHSQQQQRHAARGTGGVAARKTVSRQQAPATSANQPPVALPLVDDVDGADAEGGSRHNAGPSSAAAQQALEGLPQELHCLLDPNAAVSLPAPGSLNLALLDNQRLDRLVAALGRGRATWRRALLLYEWLKASKHAMDDRLCTTLIRVCADHGDAVSALGVYEWMRAPLSAGGASLQPTAYTYTAAMRAALGVGMHDRAMQVWNDSQAAGLSPDCRLCITYIEVCTRLGWADQALAMYAQMRDAPPGSPMRPSVHAYTAAMRAATEGHQWARALSVWEDLRRSGCQPTGHAYAAAISACAAGQDWTRAVALFDDMTSRSGIRPDVVSCTALVSALAAAGEADKAEAVVVWMQKSGLKPNVRTFTALLTAMGNACQWQRAIRLLFAMQRPENGSVQPNAFTYSALLKALGQHGQWRLAEEVFSDLEFQVRTARISHAGSFSQLPSVPSSSDLHLHVTHSDSGAASSSGAHQDSQGSGSNGGSVTPRMSAAEAARRAASFKRLMALAAAAEAQQQAGGAGGMPGLAQAQAMAAAAAAAATAALQQQFGGVVPPGAALPTDASAAAALQQAWQQQQLLGQATQQALSASTLPSPSSSTPGLHSHQAQGWQQQLQQPHAAASSARASSPGLHAAATGNATPSQPQQVPAARSWVHPSQLNGIQLDLQQSPQQAALLAAAVSTQPEQQQQHSPGASAHVTPSASSAHLAGLPGNHAINGSASSSSNGSSPLASQPGRAGGSGRDAGAAAANGWSSLASGITQDPQRWLSPLEGPGHATTGQYAFTSRLVPPSDLPSPAPATASSTASSAATPAAAGGFSFFSSQPPQSSSSASSSSLFSVNPGANGPVRLAQQGASNRNDAHHHSSRQQGGPSAASPSTSTSGGGSSSSAAAAAAAMPPLVNDVVCASLMSAYERAGKWVEAVNVLTRARMLGVEPTPGMVAVAVSAAGKAGQLEVAEQLFACLPSPDHAACEAFLGACGVAGRPDKAEQLMRVMARRGMRPRDVAYCALVTAHSMAGNAEAALGVRRRMAREGCAASVHVYNALLAACDRAGRYEHALELLQAMKVEGVEPNSTTHHLMAVVGRHGVQTVESQQVAAAALSAVFAAAGGLLIRAGMF